jgi:hypothetical protein
MLAMWTERGAWTTTVARVDEGKASDRRCLSDAYQARDTGGYVRESDVTKGPVCGADAGAATGILRGEVCG